MKVKANTELLGRNGVWGGGNIQLRGGSQHNQQSFSTNNNNNNNNSPGGTNGLVCMCVSVSRQ